MAQTTISANPAIGLAGTFATGEATPLNTRSSIAAETITVGKFVVVTADDADTCELPDADTEADGGRGLGIGFGSWMLGFGICLFVFGLCFG